MAIWRSTCHAEPKRAADATARVEAMHAIKDAFEACGWRRMQAALGQQGWVVNHNPGQHHLQCCSALEWVYNRCIPETITHTLQLIGDVWPGDPEGVKAPVIKGVAVAVHDYADAIDTGRLADVLSAVTPKQLAARAHELAARGYTGSHAKLITTAIIAAYNKATKAGLSLP